MRTTEKRVVARSWRQLAVAAAAIFILSGGAGAASAPSQKTFASPDEAAKAFITAVRAADEKEVLAILGPQAKKIIYSGDRVADRAAAERFLKSYDEANKVETSGDAKATLSVGKDGWPFPIPIVKTGSAWRFDAKQGAEEIVNRRIGRNELYVMEVMQAIVDAQREYYASNPAKDKLLQYAQRFASSKGKRDGLYYPTKEGEKPSPLGRLVATAQSQGYKAPAEAKTGAPAEGSQAATEVKPVPFHGYYFRILKAQGPDAPGGAYSYMAQGRMIGGFAVVAYPATYANSGVMTFIVSHNGVVYEKDLGPQTAEKAAAMTRFNPDNTWKRSGPGT